LDLLDPVLTFDRLIGGIDLNKYLTDISEYTTGRLRYNPVNMLKTVLFGFMTSGYKVSSTYVQKILYKNVQLF